MKNPDDEETRRSPYPSPSARQSIHKHDNCIFLDYKNMGRYGIDSDPVVRSAGSSHTQAQGTDEVDNVMSKHVRQISPIPIQQIKNQRKGRRNSLDDPETSDDDESDSNMFAKSLPANLPSYYCSNDFSSQSQQSDLSKTHNSNIFPDSRTERNRNAYNQSSSTPFKEYINNKNNQGSTQGGKSCQHIIFTLTVAIISLAVYCYKDIGTLSQGTNSIYDEIEFNKDINNLGDKYKINENSLLELQSGISTILRRNDSGSFIFVYNAKSDKFNYLRFSNFIQEIASAAVRYLRNDTKFNQPTILHSSELNMQSHSELMNKYRQDVAESGVMLVKDLDRVPSNLAMAFHYFCDEYNPLVAKSAIFFTLNFANCSDFPNQKSTHNNVEKCLANIWNTVPKDNIKPLLARVVNVVIDVTNVI